MTAAIANQHLSLRRQSQLEGLMLEWPTVFFVLDIFIAFNETNVMCMTKVEKIQ